MQIRNIGSIGTKPMIVNLIGSLLTNITEYKDKRIFVIFTYAVTHHNVTVYVTFIYLTEPPLFYTPWKGVLLIRKLEAFAPLPILLEKYSGIFVNNATFTQPLFIIEDPEWIREFLFEQYILISYERLLFLKDQ